MTRINIIMYICFISEISYLIRRTHARPYNIALDESPGAEIHYKLPLYYNILFSQKNCDKSHHTGKCLKNRSIIGKKSEVTVESDLKSSSTSQSTASSISSDDKSPAANSYDSLVHNAPMISQNFF